MERQPDADVKRILDEARALLAESRVVEAVAVYTAAFDELIAKADHFGASNIAHMAGVAEPDPRAKLTWNERALREADAVEDRDSVAGFYPSLYNDLAFSYALLGDREQAHRCLRAAWAHVDALEPGPYADQVKAAIQKRLEQFADEPR